MSMISLVPALRALLATGLTTNPSGAVVWALPAAQVGQAGVGMTIQTSAGGVGSTSGGDILINLGGNTGVATRSGQVQITATDTDTPLGAVQYNAALMVTQTLTANQAIASNRQGISVLLTTNGAGGNLGAQSVGLAAIETRHVINLTGAVAPLLYGVEFQTIPQGPGTYAAITTVQADTAVFTGGGGTVTGWSGYRHAPGPFNNVTVTVLTGFQAAGYTFVGTDSPVKIYNGFSSSWVNGSLNGTDVAGAYVIRGLFVPIANQGGNTAGTNDNIGVHVSVAAIPNSGGGLAGAGGTVRNRGVVIDMPTAQAVTGANLNFGLDITGTIGGNDANNTTYATHQDIRWNAGAGANAQIANRWSISANAANSGRLENFRLESTMNSNGSTVATWWDLCIGVPTYSLGTVTTKIGIAIRNQGAANSTNAIGLAIEAQASGATSNTNLVLGQTSAPASGNWSLYSPSTNQSAFAGPLTLGSTAAPTATSLTFADAWNIVVGTTTGTIIGTVGGASGQKLGFFAATPVVQQLMATGTAKTVDNVITALQTLGLFRQT